MTGERSTRGAALAGPECVVLGAMLLDPAAIPIVTEKLGSIDFHEPSHPPIFAAIVKSADVGEPTEPVAVTKRLLDSGDLHRVGGAEYLHELCSVGAPAEQVGHYVKMVAERAHRARVIEAAVRVQHVAENGDLETIATRLAELTELRAAAPCAATVRRTWRPVDLRSVLDGTYAAPEATVGRRIDGVGLFYPGRVHSVASDSEAGKTWLAVLAALAELDAGNAALIVDFEDGAGGVAGRAIALGGDPVLVREKFGYIRPEDPIGTAHSRDDLRSALQDLRPTLVILDGVTEAMSLHGLELKDNSDVAAFGRMLPRWIADTGPAVVALDHVVKDRESRGRYAIGGVHKLNGINGAAYLLDNRLPFGIGRIGRTGVYIAKDRPGMLRRHSVAASDGRCWFADLVIDSQDADTARGSLTVPAHGDQFRSTVLMGRVAAALAGAPEPLVMNKITGRVTGQAQTVRAAVAALVDEGYVAVEDGPRGSKVHRLVKPFTEGGAPI